MKHSAKECLDQWNCSRTSLKLELAQRRFASPWTVPQRNGEKLLVGLQRACNRDSKTSAFGNQTQISPGNVPQFKFLPWLTHTCPLLPWRPQEEQTVVEWWSQHLASGHPDIHPFFEAALHSAPSVGTTTHTGADKYICVMKRERERRNRCSREYVAETWVSSSNHHISEWQTHLPIIPKYNLGVISTPTSKTDIRVPSTTVIPDARNLVPENTHAHSVGVKSRSRIGKCTRSQKRYLCVLVHKSAQKMPTPLLLFRRHAIQMPPTQV